MKRVALFFFIFIIIISIYFYFSIDSIEIKNLNENNCIAIEDRSEKTIYLWDIVNNIAYKQKKTAWPFVIGEPYFGGGKIWFRKGLILKGNYYDNYYYCDINKIIPKQAFEADLGNDLIVGEKILRKADKNELEIIDINDGKSKTIFYEGLEFGSDGEKVCFIDKSNNVCVYDIYSSSTPKIVFRKKMGKDWNRDHCVFIEAIDNGKFIVVLDSGNNYLVNCNNDLIDVYTNKTINRPSCLGENTAILINNNLYYFADNRVYVNHLDNKTEESLINLEEYISLDYHWIIRTYFKDDIVVIALVPYDSDRVSIEYESTVLVFDYYGNLIERRRFK